MMPVRRDLKFNLLPGSISDWHGDGAHVTQFLNALSVLFPVGKRFYMDAVRNYRDRVADPALKQAAHRPATNSIPEGKRPCATDTSIS